MAKQITFRVKLNVDGKEQLVTATTDAKTLRGGLDSASAGARGLSHALMDLSNAKNVIDGITNTLGDLSSKLSAYNRSAQQAQQLTGLQGSELKKMRAEAQAVADTYGLDLQEVLMGVSQMMKGFGTDADTAMRLVRDGLMSGANATGQMFDQLSEYPAYFKEAGVSAEQFMAVVTTGANMGVFSDKAADTVKEGNLRLREMTTATQDALNGIGLDATKIQEQLQSGALTTFQVMQQVGDKLKELPQTSAAVGTAIADIFGGPGEDAGLAFIESLSGISSGMEDLKANATDASKSLDSQVGALSTLNAATLSVVDAFNSIPGLTPLLNITAQIGSTVVGVVALSNALKSLGAAALVTSVRTQLIPAALRAYQVAAVSAAAIGRVLQAAYTGQTVGATTAAVATQALKVAIRGLLIATGVGIAIVALTEAVNFLVNAFDDASGSAGDLADANAEAQASSQQYEQEIASVRAEMEQNIATLKNFKGSKEEEAKLVEKMNNKYGDALGYYDSVSNWYGALVANSEAYCQQMIREIQLRQLANEAAQHQIKIDKIGQGISSGQYSSQRETAVRVGSGQKNLTNPYAGGVTISREEIKGSSPLEKAQAQLKAEQAALAQIKTQMAKVASQTTTYKTTAGHSTVRPTNVVKPTGGGRTTSGGGRTTPSHTTTTTTKEENTRLDEINELLKKKEDAAQKASGATLTGLQKEIDALKDEKAQIELKIAAIERPLQLDSLNDINAEIAYQQKLYNSANTSELAGINKTIKALEELKQTFEDVGHEVKDPAKLASMEEVSAETTFWTRQLKNATDEEAKATAQAELLALKMRETELAAEEFAKTTANVTIKPVQDNQNFVKGSVEDKRASYSNAQSRGAQIESDLSAGIIDKKEAKRQLAELNKMLADFDPKLKPIEIEFDDKGFFAKVQDGYGTFSDLAGSVDGTVNSISTLVGSLESGADAWTVFMNAVNAVTSVLAVVNTLTEIAAALSATHAAAKQTETTVVMADTAAKGANATASATAAAMEATEATASLTNTAAKSGEAVASATASGAKLPFPANIAAIAISVAAVLAALASVAFADGGIVPGSSTSGDKVFARLNSGEMVLNTRQQKRLFDALNGRNMGLLAGNIGQRMSVRPSDLAGLSTAYGAATQSIHVTVDGGWKGKQFVVGTRNVERIYSKSMKILKD